MSSKKKAIYGLIGSVVLLLIIIGTSYAYIKYDTEEKSANVLGTDCISISMTDVTNSITLRKAFPMTDTNGEATDPYTFTLTNNCSVGVDYNINLRVENEGIAEDKKMPVEGNIATKVDSNDKVVLSSTNKVQKTETQTEDKYTIGSGTLEPKGTVQHSVRIWLDETAGNETQNKVFKSKVIVEAIQNQIVDKTYKEELLNGADPVLGYSEDEKPTGDKLIPVKIEEAEGTGTTVTVADLTEEWYNYGKKEWANAVILKDSIQNPNPGTILNEDDIESYFVWIPKYKYKLFNLEEYSEGTEREDKSNQAIEIVFGLDNTTDSDEKQECATPMLENGVQGASGDIGKCKKDNYMTHPAFLAFGGNGLWVGKFETGEKDATKSGAIQRKTYDSADLSKIIVKPNEYAWTLTNVSTMHLLSLNYQRNLDSHMMKNTEWGAVAYLTQSIYGRCTSSTSCTEVTINNNGNRITGFAGSSVSQSEATADPKNDAEKTYNYDNHNSVKASTTGNYTGIYDMSGGTSEYVMGVVIDEKGTPYSGYSNNENSGFSGSYVGSGTGTVIGVEFPDKKYYDEYKYQKSNQMYTNRILGDATGEMGPFGTYPASSYYWDRVYVAFASGPWYSRGSSYSGGSYAGIFESDYEWGRASNGAFRIVLAPL